MSVCCTCPGRAGDILWALLVIRALSRRLDQQIHLEIAGEFGTLVPLLERQPYLAGVWANPEWAMAAGWQPPGMGQYYDQVFHIGYRRWPELPLPYETLHTLNAQSALGGSKWTLFGTIPDEDLHLDEPWITNLPAASPTEIAVGFSECHFELKVGLVTLLAQARPSMVVLTHSKQTRWWMERPLGGYQHLTQGPWLAEASIIRNADVFLGCNSGLHVLAVAVGTPVIMYEPMTARHNPIFFPVGMDGPKVTIVRGLDGQPTTDSRHTREVLERMLEKVASR